MYFGCEFTEVDQYFDARYVSALEVAWQLFAMDMHEEHPYVVRLALHLPRMQGVVFNQEEEDVEVLRRARYETTTLTWIFARCARDTKCLTIHIFGVFLVLCVEKNYKRMDP